jgi:hypothetical protein
MSAASTIEYFEHQVTPLDNLTKLAVQYKTSIAAIRRLNPDLLLKNHIPPTVKMVKVPKSNKIKQTLMDSEEIKMQTIANDRLFKEKAFMQKFNCELEEALYYLSEKNYNLEEAINLLQKEIEAAKISEFIRKVGGDCTVDEARVWLGNAKWKVEMAVHFFKSYRKVADSYQRPFHPSAPSFSEDMYCEEATEMQSLLRNDNEVDWHTE